MVHLLILRYAVLMFCQLNEVSLFALFSKGCIILLKPISVFGTPDNIYTILLQVIFFTVAGEH